MTHPALEAGIRAVGFSSAAFECVWSVIAVDADVGTALTRARPWLTPVIAEMAEALPMPNTVMPFAAPPFFRPAGSHRCFYYGHSMASEGADLKPGGPVIAFKGVEPCLCDFDAILRELRRACYSPHTMADHLVFEERKIPGCVGIEEAIREAERALIIQRAHLNRYGSFARLPVPLGVFRHHGEVVERTIQGLRQVLTPDAFESVRPMVASGLGIYVYYYTGVPIRARDLDYLLNGLGFRERLLALLRYVHDPETVIRRWAEAFVRILLLGYVPGSLSSLRTGICCQPQNACIDGGFVDLDSITPIRDLNETALQAALQFSCESLVQTVRTLVAGGADPARAESSGVRIDLHHLGDYVFALMRAALSAERGAGYAVDPRVARYFTPASSLAELVDRLGSYYAPTSEFDPAAREVSRFTRELLLASREC